MEGGLCRRCVVPAAGGHRPWLPDPLDHRNPLPGLRAVPGLSGFFSAGFQGGICLPSPLLGGACDVWGDFLVEAKGQQMGQESCAGFGGGVSFGLRGAADSGRSPDGDRGGREPDGSALYDSEAGSLTSENE